MKKILERGYTCILFVFFTLFLLLIRQQADNQPILFSISLILGSIILAISAFLLNKCKKIAVRRWYLISMVVTCLFVVLQSIYLLLLNVFLKNPETYEVANNVCLWIIRIVLAMSITSVIFQVFYTVKDFFKKGYEIQKFDFHTIQMALNMISFLLINYIVFDYSGYSITLHLDPVNYKPSYTVDYGNYSIVLNGLLIIIAAYICIYCLLEYIKYVKFEKQEIKSDRDFK